MALIACNCPNCNGQLDFDDSRQIMFCSYCGTKVVKEQVLNITNNITIAEGYQIHDADWYSSTIIELFNQERNEETDKFLEDFGNYFPLDKRLLDLRNLKTVFSAGHVVSDEFLDENRRKCKKFSFDGISAIVKTYTFNEDLSDNAEFISYVEKEFSTCKTAINIIEKRINDLEYSYDNNEIKDIANKRIVMLNNEIQSAREDFSNSYSTWQETCKKIQTRSKEKAKQNIILISVACCAIAFIILLGLL